MADSVHILAMLGGSQDGWCHMNGSPFANRVNLLGVGVEWTAVIIDRKQEPTIGEWWGEPAEKRQGGPMRTALGI